MDNQRSSRPTGSSILRPYVGPPLCGWHSCRFCKTNAMRVVDVTKDKISIIRIYNCGYEMKRKDFASLKGQGAYGVLVHPQDGCAQNRIESISPSNCLDDLFRSYALGSSVS